jgi:glycine/D-amino acid oxidase-like deaminating enzyme/nitrite reductase/ring-hydroxylating ferredoxin subunit
MTDPDVTSGASGTPWLATVQRPIFPKLTGDLEVDVAVVGGGIFGLSAAYFLAQEGKSVVVLEDGVIGSGETGRTTAHLASALDDRFYRLEQLHGADRARLAWQSHAAAIDKIEAVVRMHQIECDFGRLPGYLFPSRDESPDIIDREFEACKRIGVEGVEKLERTPLGDGPCLKFDNQGQFHVLKYLSGIAVATVRQGGRIFERSHVEDWDIQERVKVMVAGGGTVTASDLIVATNAPIASRVKIPLRQFPYRTYVVALRLRRGELPRGLYWDTADPYHYLRFVPAEEGDGGLLLVGGEDHKTGQPGKENGDERYARLEAWARERVPQAGDVQFRWSGQILEPADGLAFIGKYSDHVYIATGDSGQGMTHGTIAGMVLRDLLIGRDNPWATLYDPSRSTLRGFGEIASENLNVLPKYGQWMTGGDVKGPREIPLGEGRVVRRGLKKLAIYRDEKGALHTLSAVCPHLGCIVAWNETEKTWDCPCHGSRFGGEGQVLNGPANSGLEEIRKPPSRMAKKRTEPDRSAGRKPGKRRTKK